MKNTLSFFNSRLAYGSIIVIAITAMAMFFFKGKCVIKKHPPQISVASVVKKVVPIEVKVPGLTQSQEAVQIRSRVDGIIKQLHFQEGQIVKKNDLLFTLDDETVQAQLRQAEANLAKNMALFEDAKAEVKRNNPLLKKGFITQSAFEQLQANMKSLEGETKSDQAAIDLMKVQLGYTKSKVPLWV